MQKAAVAKKVHSSRVRLAAGQGVQPIQFCQVNFLRIQALGAGVGGVICHGHRGSENARHSPHLGICGTGGIIDPGDCIFCAAHFATAFHHSRTDLQG